MADESCGNCRHSVLLESPDNGIRVCRRYPPQITDVTDGKVTSHWPLLHHTAVCGEWARRPTNGHQS